MVVNIHATPLRPVSTLPRYRERQIFMERGISLVRLMLDLFHALLNHVTTLPFRNSKHMSG